MSCLLNCAIFQGVLIRGFALLLGVSVYNLAHHLNYVVMSSATEWTCH